MNAGQIFRHSLSTGKPTIGGYQSQCDTFYHRGYLDTFSFPDVPLTFCSYRTGSLQTRACAYFPLTCPSNSDRRPLRPFVPRWRRVPAPTAPMARQRPAKPIPRRSGI
jgi:hypothetical protein